MKQNLGKLDRIFRFLLGVWWLSSYAPHFSLGWANWIVHAVGWIALLESLIGWCLLHNYLGINNKNQ